MIPAADILLLLTASVSVSHILKSHINVISQPSFNSAAKLQVCRERSHEMRHDLEQLIERWLHLGGAGAPALAASVHGAARWDEQGEGELLTSPCMETVQYLY